MITPQQLITLNNTDPDLPIMIVHNPRLTNRFINIIHNSKIITFFKTFSYLAYKDNSNNIYAWIGKNYNSELLVIVFSKTIYIHVLANNGHFFGEGLANNSIILQQNTHLKKGKYLNPKHLSYFIKPNQTTSTLLKPIIAPIPPLPAPSYLIIKVLFCYSSNYLSTYITPSRLTDDNVVLCAVASGILNNNNPPNNVILMGVANIEVDNIENGATCLDNDDEIGDLFERYINNELPLATSTAIALQTNLTVFQTKYCTDPDEFTYGTSYTIGFQSPKEACVCLIRPPVITDTLLSNDEPTVLIHEIGHILGCSHNLEIGEIPDPNFTPGYGHAILDSNGKVRTGTIMSYADYPIWYFSNPTIFKYPSPDQNIPCGVAGISEAHSVISANLPRLASSTLSNP